MIRFSAALVVVGLGLLLAGAIASEMALVYAAIAVSVCSALVLAAGMIAGRHELFGRSATAAGDERTLDRGVTPGPGTRAIPGDAAGERLLSLGDRSPAAVAAQAGSVGPNYTGVGWPSAKSPADELWARVDAELAAAGAAARTPKLTKESTADEVWGRVEQELGAPAQWNSRVVIPAAEETGPAEPEPAAEVAADPAWAQPAAWAEPAGWDEGAGQAGQLVAAGPGDADGGGQAGTTEASTTTGQGANGAQHLAPVESTAAGDAAGNRWSPKPAGWGPEASDQNANAGAGPDHPEAAAVGAGVVEDTPDAGPDSSEAVPAGAEATPDSAETGPESAEAGVDSAESGQDTADAGPASTETGPDSAESAPASAEAGPANAGAGPASAEAGPASAESGPDSGDARPDSAEARQDDAEASPDSTGDAGPDSAETASSTRSPDEDADPDPAGTAPGGATPDVASVTAPAAGDHGDHAPAAASPQAQTQEVPATELGRDPGPGLLAAPPAAQTMPAAFREHGEPGSAAPGRVVVVSGVPRYHRPGCILIRFLGQDDMESVTREAAEASGCVPCRACLPDKLPSAAESGVIG